MKCCTVYWQSIARLAEKVPAVPYEIIIFNQHKCLRNFFAANRFKIGLRSMFFRMLFSRHMSAKYSSNAAVPLCCKAHSSIVSVWKMNVPMCNWSPSCSWTLWVEGQHWGADNFQVFIAVISDPTHVLRRLLPEVRQLSYNLRPRPHGFLYSLLRMTVTFFSSLYTKTCINSPLAA